MKKQREVILLDPNGKSNKRGFFHTISSKDQWRVVPLLLLLLGALTAFPNDQRPGTCLAFLLDLYPSDGAAYPDRANIPGHRNRKRISIPQVNSQFITKRRRHEGKKFLVKKKKEILLLRSKLPSSLRDESSKRKSIRKLYFRDELIGT